MAIWPVWVSLSLRDAERDTGRRRALSTLIGIGVLVAAGSALMMLRSPPVATIAGHSIRYASVAVGNHAVGILLLFAYLVPTIAPFFVSTLRTARTIGITLVDLIDRDARHRARRIDVGVVLLRGNSELADPRRGRASQGPMPRPLVA